MGYIFNRGHEVYNALKARRKTKNPPYRCSYPPARWLTLWARAARRIPSTGGGSVSVSHLVEDGEGQLRHRAERQQQRERRVGALAAAERLGVGHRSRLRRRPRVRISTRILG